MTLSPVNYNYFNTCPDPLFTPIHILATTVSYAIVAGTVSAFVIGSQILLTPPRECLKCPECTKAPYKSALLHASFAAGIGLSFGGMIGALGSICFNAHCLLDTH